MSWLTVGSVLAGFLAIVLVVRVLRRRSVDIEIVFDMTLPSKWGAELTQQVLENEGTRAEIGQVNDEWHCRVTLGERFEAKRCERLRAHFDQIAAGRGGGCPNVRVVRGDEVIVYEARARLR